METTSRLPVLCALALAACTSASDYELAGSGATHEATTASALVDDSACQMASDEEYGLSLDHPVRVGGEFDEGVDRSIAFMETLRGPNGEGLAFHRLGSQWSEAEQRMVDLWELSTPDETVVGVVFVNIYSWEQPLVPMGFTCVGPFPFGPWEP